MITRITKFQIKRENRQAFSDFLHQFKDELASFDGCKHMDILQDKSDSNHLFMLMIWLNEETLENFRQSELNRLLVQKLESFSTEKPTVWTVENVFDPELDKQQPKLF